MTRLIVCIEKTLLRNDNRKKKPLRLYNFLLAGLFFCLVLGQRVMVVYFSLNRISAGLH